MSDTLALVVALICDNPATIEKLLTEHIDDGSGHCRRCRLPGQRGFDSWPCLQHTAATLAAARGPAVPGIPAVITTSGARTTQVSPGTTAAEHATNERP